MTANERIQRVVKGDRKRMEGLGKGVFVSDRWKGLCKQWSNDQDRFESQRKNSKGRERRSEVDGEVRKGSFCVR